VALALSTGHEVGLGVAGAAFIAFALASSFLFPRFRPQYPGGGLPAFIVVAFVFFFGMLTAVEVFGADKKEGGERVAQTSPATTATTQQTTTSQQSATTSKTTTTTTVPSAPVAVSESEFKIDAKTQLAAGDITFHVTNDGKIPHDLAIKGQNKRTKLIPPGASADLSVTLKAGTYELYCSVPGHEQAGMKLNITVS